MGVVIKQSFWGTILTYIGVCVGYVNALYVRAEYLTLDQIGLFTLITSNAMMISPFALFGMSSSYLKFFSFFDQKGRDSFFSFLFVITFIGISLTLGIGYILKDVLAERYLETAPEYIKYLSITGVVIVTNSFFELFMNYSRTILKVIFPVFIREVFLKTGSLLLVLGYATNWWSFDGAIIGLGLNYSLAFLMLFLHLVLKHKLKIQFDLKILTREFKKKLIKFAFYSMMLAGSFALINNVSYDQLTAIVGTDASGVFNTCFFIAVIVELPRRNMANIISPLLSTEIEKNNIKEVENLYKKSSITMSVIGALLFIGITTNIDDLFNYIPKGESFRTGIWVIASVCSVKLFVMISSFAGEIINFSNEYIYNLYSQILAAILLISLNIILIPNYGLTGVSISYFIAIFVQLGFRGIFVWKKFKIHPFIPSHLQLLLIFALVWLGAYIFDLHLHPILNIAIRSVLTTIVFTFFIYKMNVSKDITRLIDMSIQKFRL